MPEQGAIPDLVQGQQLGRYRIESPLSQGAMGAVYRAINTVTGEPAAVKRMLDRENTARFEIEARLLSQLQHPRVVKVLDHFQDADGLYYIVMELVQGTDLGECSKASGSPGLPVREAIEHTRQTCEALQYVHEQQIVHRDVKPQNMILGEGGITLVDFGVARELGETDTGTVGVGTPRFMAPEVFAGGQVTPRADVFGVSATLWNLITGKAPVYADDTPLAEMYPEVSPELEETLRAGLHILPERRVASVSAFAAALGSPLIESQGASLALSLKQSDAPRSLIEAVVRTAAGVFEAAAASIALIDRTTRELVYQAAWGAGAKEIVGVRLAPGTGIAGSVISGARGSGRAGVPHGPALREADRGRHRLRAQHDGGGAAQAWPTRRGRALDTRPPRRRRLRPGGREPRRAVRRAGAGRARRGARRVHQPGHGPGTGAHRRR